MRHTFAALTLATLVFASLAGRPHLRAQDAAAEPRQPAPAATPADAARPETAGDEKEPLSASQELLARRYKRFVDTLRKVAENIKRTDPVRADLLNRAIGQSNKEGVSRQLDEIVQMLKAGDPRFDDVIDEQKDVVASLNAILTLLMSEDESANNKAEQARIEAYLKKLNEIINKQKDTRAATERKESPDDLARRQQKLKDQAEGLGKQIAKDDEAKRAAAQGADGKPSDAQPSDNGESKEGKPGESKEGDSKEGKPGDPKEGKPGDSEQKPGEQKPGEQKPGEQKPGESKPGEGKPMEGSPMPGQPMDGMPGEGSPMPGQPMPGQPMPGQPMPGQPMPGKPMPGQPGQPGESQPQEQKDNTPGREELEKAREEMERAIQQLQKKAHDRASDHQDEVLKELQKAKEKLEEILRQLRDEEKTRFLQALEARFQKMLTMQVLVYDATTKLDKTQPDQRTNAFNQRGHELGRTEGDIIVEANRALTLLREEGSAVAFPEAVEQMRDDMQMVARWLSRDPEPDTGKLTQAVEKEIIDALEEMIEALQKEMEKMKEKDQKDKEQQQQQGENEDQLVDMLGELKLLRSLQYRINRRTKTLGIQVKGEQAQDQQIVEQLQNLADRQSRIQKAASDLATGRNK